MKGSALSQLGRRTAEPAITWLMREALVRPGLISLAAGFTDNPSLPVDITRDIMADMLRSGKTGQPPLQYGTTAGDETLRALTARRLAQLDGQSPKAKAYSPSRMMITHGSQQAIELLAPERLNLMPTKPENIANQVAIDVTFWADYGEQLEQRFNAWAAK